MNDNVLKQLLRQADATADRPPVLPTDLASRVRGLAGRRRQHVRVMLRVAAVLVLVTGGTLMWPKLDHDISTGTNAAEPAAVVKPTNSPDQARLRTELTLLESEAQMRVELVRRTRELIIQREISQESNARTNFPDAVANVRREVDRAAFTLVSQADRICREQHLCASAARKYKRVVELFPNSCWATVARQRLSELKSKGELL